MFMCVGTRVCVHACALRIIYVQDFALDKGFNYDDFTACCSCKLLEQLGECQFRMTIDYGGFYCFDRICHLVSKCLQQFITGYMPNKHNICLTFVCKHMRNRV